MKKETRQNAESPKRETCGTASEKSDLNHEKFIVFDEKSIVSS